MGFEGTQFNLSTYPRDGILLSQLAHRFELLDAENMNVHLLISTLLMFLCGRRGDIVVSAAAPHVCVGFSDKKNVRKIDTVA